VDAAEGSDEIDTRGRLEPYAGVECGAEATHCRRECCSVRMSVGVSASVSVSIYVPDLLACREGLVGVWWGQQLMQHLTSRLI
jgi:hypothetical protein